MNINEHHRLGSGFFGISPDNKSIDVFYDQAIMDYRQGKAIAVLLEPKSLITDAYDYCEKHTRYYRYIFTHDTSLLRQPNARYLNWSSVWHKSDVKKTKGISIISSYKDWCPLHKARIELAKYFENVEKVDCFGSYRDKDKWVDVKEAHEKYKFAIVIENDIDDYWYTEKILNCFSNKVVPIYVGARRIGDIFNPNGIIQVENWQLIPEIVRTLDIDTEYEKRKAAIEDNYKRVKPYETPWTERFINDYGWLIEELENE